MEQKKVINGIAKQTDDLVLKLEKFFKDLPHLPENIREVLVKVAPWFALVFGILGLLAGVGDMGRSPVAMFGGARTGIFVFITGMVTIVSSVLMLLAYPKLAKRKYQGWVYLFWAEMLNAVYAVLSAISGLGGVVGAILGVLIGLYLLFEIKRYYK